MIPYSARISKRILWEYILSFPSPKPPDPVPSMGFELIDSRDILMSVSLALAESPMSGEVKNIDIRLRV